MKCDICIREIEHPNIISLNKYGGEQHKYFVCDECLEGVKEVLDKHAKSNGW